MARLARVVAQGAPHHVTQPGDRRQQTFSCDDDYLLYIELMAKRCSRSSVAVWAYCLMPSHVLLIVVPSSEGRLCCAVGEAHRRYSRRINFREGWRGHLWQGRFTSYPMNERHLLAATGYVELNLVRAALVKSPGAYSWSSAAEAPKTWPARLGKISMVSPNPCPRSLKEKTIADRVPLRTQDPGA